MKKFSGLVITAIALAVFFSPASAQLFQSKKGVSPQSSSQSSSSSSSSTKSKTGFLLSDIVNNAKSTPRSSTSGNVNLDIPPAGTTPKSTSKDGNIQYLFDTAQKAKGPNVVPGGDPLNSPGTGTVAVQTEFGLQGGAPKGANLLSTITKKGSSSSSSSAPTNNQPLGKSAAGIVTK